MTTTEFIVTIIVAVIGSNGVWAFLSHILDKNSSRHKEIQDLTRNVQDIKQEINELCSIMNKTNNLAKATARDRLNYLSRCYKDQGFIPKEDVVPYKLMGEAYKESDGNTIVAEEFNLCMDELPRK